MSKWTSAMLCLVMGAGLETEGTSSVPPSIAFQHTAAIQSEDVSRFYRVYDKANGHPTAQQLQHDYIDKGTQGLHAFARIRNITGERIALEIAEKPDLYVNARRCVASLPPARRRLVRALGRLRELYPAATMPPITVVIGRGRPIGVGSPVSGLQIGLEALCGFTYIDADPEDRFVHVVAHEYVHVQQPREIVDDPDPTVLEGSLIEGAAEFIGELISGGVADPNLTKTMRGHEAEIETAFVKDKENKDLSHWLYNGTLETPGDLGYRVGYRIVKSFYNHAADKKAAIREIIQMRDPEAFLVKSGWFPGIAEP